MNWYGERVCVGRCLALVLRCGSWLASGGVALGPALVRAGWCGPVHRAGLSCIDIITAGIVLLILLPAFRVALMLIAFLRDRDYRFAVIAALVLIIIFAGFVLGMRTAGTAG